MQVAKSEFNDSPQFSHQLAASSGASKATLTSDQLATNLGVPMSTLRFNRPLPQVIKTHKTH